MIRDLYAIVDKPAQRMLTMLLIASTLAAAAQGIAFAGLFPFLTSFISDDDAVSLWLMFILIATIITWMMVLFTGFIGRASSAAILRSLLSMLGERISRLPLSYFRQGVDGSLADMASSGIGFAAAVPHVVVRPVITGIVTPAVIALATCVIDWRIGIIMIGAAPLLWLAYRRIGAASGESDHHHTEAVAEVTTRLIEFSRSQSAIRAAGPNSIGDQVVDDALQRQHDTFAQATATQGAAIGRLGSLVQAVFSAIVIVAVIIALRGGMDYATLVALLIVVSCFTEPIVNAGALSGGFSSGRNTLAELRKLREIPVLSEPNEPVTPTSHDVEFAGVDFNYGESRILSQISFTVPEHSLVAVVGPSGAGKTTIMRLLSRFMDPDAGTISIGGVPLPSIGTEQVNQLVTPVFQDTFLIEGTIRDNLLLARPKATDTELQVAATAAALDGLIDKNGWNMDVGEGGSLLSGGERQRVAIARALLKDSPIITLDEPTSSLDAVTERVITDTMHALRADHTVIVVAHQLNTIRDADHIVVLNEAGQIVEQGTHDELMKLGGQYHHHWQIRTTS